MNAIIVGSGIAGLATAVRLAVLGYNVTVFEANNYPGGKLSEFKLGPYRFDAGPSLLATPELINDLFKLANKPINNAFKVKKLDKSCVYFYADGTTFTAWHKKQKFLQEVKEKFNFKNTQAVEKYLNNIAQNYNLTAPLFIEQSLHKAANFFNVKTLKGIANFRRLNLFKSMNDVNEQAFKNPYLTQYFNRFATYNGSNPYQAPGLLNIIAHLEHHFGTFIPEGGMYAITQSIYNLAVSLGVRFFFNNKVSEIVTENVGSKHALKVAGVKVNGQIFKGDIVVSNSDIQFTYRKLLPNIKAPESILAQEKSSSALIFYWGIKQQFKQLDLHNIFFSANYQQEFDYIFNKKEVYNDPTVYVNITSKYVAGDAPPNCENWFVMINVPNNTGQPWDEIITTARQNIILKLNQLLHTNIEALIEVEHFLDPRSIESRTGSYLGALYGNASNNRYAAFLRHKNFSNQVKGLYFCGGSVHPGGGIPLCLHAAKITAELIKQDFK
jgi:phytoene desaturase